MANEKKTFRECWPLSGDLPERDYIRNRKRWCLHHFFRKDLTMAKGNNSQGKDKKKAKAKAPVKAAKKAGAKK